MRPITRLIAVLTLAWTGAANGALIEGLCNGGADASVTCDKVTGLEWLDMTETDGLSVDLFLADSGGFITDNWSWATTARLDELFWNTGAVRTDGVSDAGNDPAIDLLIATMGSIVGCGNPGACGFSDNGLGTATVNYYYEPDSRIDGSPLLRVFCWV